MAEKRVFGTDGTVFGPDGTQEPPPPPLLPDPLGGLVTGALLTEDFSSSEVRVRPAAPPKPDERAIRQAVDAAMAEERNVRPATRPRRTPPPARRSGLPSVARSGTTGLSGTTMAGSLGSAGGWMGPRRELRNPPRTTQPGGSTRIGPAGLSPSADWPPEPAAALPKRGPGTERSGSAARTVVRIVLWLVVIAAVVLVIALQVMHGSSGSVGG